LGFILFFGNLDVRINFNLNVFSVRGLIISIIDLNNGLDRETAECLSEILFINFD